MKRKLFPLIAVSLAALVLTCVLGWAAEARNNNTLKQEKSLLLRDLIDAHKELDSQLMENR